jgi:hypothetical protein
LASPDAEGPEMSYVARVRLPVIEMWKRFRRGEMKSLFQVLDGISLTTFYALLPYARRASVHDADLNYFLLSLFTYLFAYLFTFYLFAYSFTFYLFIYLFVYLLIRSFAYLFICLFIYFLLFVYLLIY